MRKIALLALLVALPLSLHAGESQGEALERQMWADMKAHNWVSVENHITADFQSIHENGARSRSQELSLIKNLSLGEVLLSDFKVTEGTDTLIVTYMVATNETIDAQHLSSKPSPRMSVWQNNNGSWKWAAHANLTPLK
ncbi:MAG: hypothetical protein JWO53_1386 [Chlamydiia bacterium]|nr:hypothetical protein [Chlamydiia bacterium]